MSQNLQRTGSADVPFQSVETVSTEMFDRLVEIDRVEDLSPAQTAVTKSRLQRLGEYLLDAAPKMGTEDAATISDDQPEFDFALMVEGLTEGDYFAMSRAAGERQKARARQTAAEREAERVSYRAARTRSNLPEGIELLEGRRARYSDDDIMSAVKGVMVQQKYEARTVKQQPTQRPSAPRPVLKVAPKHQASNAQANTEYTALVAKRNDVLNGWRHRLARHLVNDTVLAVSLSLWAALLLMTFIEPSVAHLLVGVCVYLGFVYVLALESHLLSQPVLVWGRKPSA